MPLRPTESWSLSPNRRLPDPPPRPRDGRRPRPRRTVDLTVPSEGPAQLTAAVKQLRAHDRPRLREQPWWTPADQAELELLTYELVEAAHSHAERMPSCCNGDLLYCPEWGAVIGAVLDWRAHRVRHSLAAWLRRAQDWKDAADVA